MRANSICPRWKRISSTRSSIVKSSFEICLVLKVVKRCVIIHDSVELTFEISKARCLCRSWSNSDDSGWKKVDSSWNFPMNPIVDSINCSCISPITFTSKVNLEISSNNFIILIVERLIDYCKIVPPCLCCINTCSKSLSRKKCQLIWKTLLGIPHYFSLIIINIKTVCFRL